MTDHAIQRPAGGVPREVLVFATALIAMTIGGRRSPNIPASGGSPLRSPSLRGPSRYASRINPTARCWCGAGPMARRLPESPRKPMRSSGRRCAGLRESASVPASAPRRPSSSRRGGTDVSRSMIRPPARRIPLEAFGETNAGVFAALLQTSGALR